jgi:hypothetical protein
MTVLSSCNNDSIYTILFYDVRENIEYVVGHTNEKVYSIDVKALEFNECPQGRTAGLIIFESDTYIGITPYEHLYLTNDQMENQDYNFVNNKYLELTEEELVVTWYEKQSSEEVSFQIQDLYYYVTLGYYQDGEHPFYFGAYELGAYDNLGNQLQHMFLYNYGSGFAIFLDSGSSIATKFQFLNITIENTKDDVKILMPSGYIGGVIKLDLEINEKQYTNFENQDVELFAIPHVDTSLMGY